MKKFSFVILIGIAVLVVAGAVIAAPNNQANRRPATSGIEIEVPQQAIDSAPVIERVIVSTPNLWDKFFYWFQGCKSVRKISDGVAYKCSPKVAEELIASGRAREDRIFKIIDSEADVQINADDVWDQGIDGTGVNVAVLDTGIDTDHSELSDSYLGGYDYVYDDAYPEDDHGHGTHVSGIITANGVDANAKGVDANAKGVAPGAGIYMYKVCDAGGSCYESDMMAAMDAAVLTDAKVMSISIGGGNFAGENCDSDPLAAKVNWVVSRGITVAVAAGNDQYYVSSPACASGAIAVGAVDKNDLMASFGNFGPSLDIVAPGVDIYSSIIGGYDSWSGTSMSTPHVSGTVALVLDANPDLTVAEIKTALYETADPINPNSVCYGVVKQAGPNYWIGVVPCSSDNYGAGIVDAYGAVNYYVPTITCSLDAECDDANECTTDTCVYPETISSYCENTAVADNTTCTGGICCAGTCTVAVCSADTDCNDAEICTTDTCIDAGICSASCSNTWPSCSLTSDECCGPLCNSTNDTDCVAEPVCCGDGYCAGNFEGQLNGEDCNTCPADCPSKTTGKPSGRYCCGNGNCESAEESPENCPVDCLE